MRIRSPLSSHSSPPESADQAQAQVAEVATFVGCEILKGIGSQLVEVGLDQLWGKDVSSEQRVAELQGRLAAYESGLRQVASSSQQKVAELAGRQSASEAGLREVAGKLADQVASLRKEISTRTTADNVRKVVEREETLKELEDRTGQLEYRQDRVDLASARSRNFRLHPDGHAGPAAGHGLKRDRQADRPPAPGRVAPPARPIRTEPTPPDRTRPDLSADVAAAQGRAGEGSRDPRRVEKAPRESDSRAGGEAPRTAGGPSGIRPGAREVRKVNRSLATLTWLAAVARPVKPGPTRVASPCRASFSASTPPRWSAPSSFLGSIGPRSSNSIASISWRWRRPGLRWPSSSHALSFRPSWWRPAYRSRNSPCRGSN